MEQDAGLKLVFIGVVAVDKKPSEELIKVYPVERLSFEVGDIKDEDVETEAVAVNIDGVSAKATIKRNSVMEISKWFPNGDDGRQTPPDVVNGETVKVYRFRDSEVYFWSTMFREVKLRRLEHVAYAFSNLEKGRNAFGLDSSYGNIFSTRDKYIKIWTSTSNGEKYKYEFKIDTERSLYYMVDNIKNGFGFESEQTRVWMQNASKTIIELVKEVINGNAGDRITWTAGRVFEVKSPLSTFSKDVVIDGNLTVKGNVSIGGSISAGGSIRAGGTITAPDIYES